MESTPTSPQGRIRTLALCLLRRGEEILVHVDHDKIKQDAYARPLGGGVEFGERAETAVIREIREELSAEIENVRLFGVLENLFTLEGKESHEIVFVFDAEFQDKSLYQLDQIEGLEGHRSFQARWMTPARMRAEKLRFVPEALADLLR